MYKNLRETYQSIIERISDFLKRNVGRYLKSSIHTCKIDYDNSDIKVTLVPMKPETRAAYQRLGEELHQQQQIPLESRVG